MHRITIAALLAATIAAGQTQPTAGELLQKGIYAQETAGDYDGAAKIYRQIVDSHPMQREIGAQAQYRLGQTLLQKGDATGAATEIQRLSYEYPDYKDLIASAKSAAGPHRYVQFRVDTQELDAKVNEVKALNARSGATQLDAFDSTRSVTVVGSVVQISMRNTSLSVNPISMGGDFIQPMHPPLLIYLASPADLSGQGWNQDLFKTLNGGDRITIIGSPARDGSSVIQADYITMDDRVIFTRPKSAASLNGATPEEVRRAKLVEAGVIPPEKK